MKKKRFSVEHIVGAKRSRSAPSIPRPATNAGGPPTRPSFYGRCARAMS
jgi:hypothetical protein